jgi:transcriptional regulator with XRE-family HTH domain
VTNAPSPTPMSLADKLKHLRDTVRHPDGRKYTYAEVAAHITERTGERRDRGYVSAIANGVNTNPTMKALEAIAEFFHVSPAYFFNDEKSADIIAQLEFAKALKDGGVRELAARQLLDVDPHDLPTVTRLLSGLIGRADPDSRASG